MKKLCVLLAVLVALGALLGLPAQAAEEEAILGFYKGSCSAQQVEMGLTLTVLEADTLASDDVLLRELAALTGGGLSTGDLRAAVEEHDGRYIALLYFYPGSDQRSGSGLYTMEAASGEGGFELTGSRWLWQEGSSFMDLKNLTLKDGKLKGDVYGEYSLLFWTQYGDVGDVELTRQGGDRVYFPDTDLTLEQYRKQTLSVAVRNDKGQAVHADALNSQSSDEAVVKVDAQGVLSPLTPGTAKITARTAGGFEAVCSVTVTQGTPPVSMEVTSELLSQISYDLSGSVPMPRFAPAYRITLSVTNDTQSELTGLTLTLEGLTAKEEQTQTLATLAPGENVQVSWNVEVEADRTTGGEFPYTLAAESSEYAPVTRQETLSVAPFEGTDNRLNGEGDRWFFTNISSVFKNGYDLPEGYLQTLGNVERARVEDYLQGGWQGSDYGMAVVAALMKTGQLRPGDYRQGATKLSQLPSPRDDSTVAQLITQYQVSQLLDGMSELWEQQLQLTEQERLQGLVTAAELVEFGGMPVVVTFRYQEDGTLNSHTLAAYDVEYGTFSIKNPVTGETLSYDKRVILYDPNAANPSYLYITQGFDSFYMDGYCCSIADPNGTLRHDSEGYFVYADTPEKLLPDTGAEGVRLESDVSGELTLGSGQTFPMSGVSLMGNPMSYLTGSGVCYAPAFSDKLTVKPQGIARLQCTYPGMLLTAETQGTVTFGAGGLITVQTPDEAYVLRTVFDEAYGQKNWYAFTVDGFGNVTVAREADGSLMLSGDSLRGIRLWAKGDGEFSKTIASDATAVRLVEEQGTLVLYADPDGDGVFDTPAEEVVTPEPDEDDTHKDRPGQTGSANPWKTVALVVLALIICAAAAGIVFVLKSGIVTIQINPPKKKK